MPNTNPVADTRATVDFVTSRANQDGAVRVLKIGAVTAGSRGERLVEMGELADAGVIGFSDDGLPVSNSNIMRQALSYSSTFGLPIINHCEERSLSLGSMTEGWVSNRLGLLGIPNSAEEVMVARDIGLAKLTGGRLHIAHASTAGTIELVSMAAQEGLSVTCEVTPHHLTLSEEAVLGDGHADRSFGPLGASAYDTNAKVAPPLRTRADVASLVQGLKEGSIDFIATDHAPHATVDKLTTFDKAASGISSLETALGSLMSLVHDGDITLQLLIEKLTAAPARFLGRNLGSLKSGFPADVTVFDPNKEWVVDPSAFVSKGKNTPLSGVALKGRVIATIVAGDVVYQQNG
jgi:dihydroorotase